MGPPRLYLFISFPSPSSASSSTTLSSPAIWISALSVPISHRSHLSSVALHSFTTLVISSARLLPGWKCRIRRRLLISTTSSPTMRSFLWGCFLMAIQSTLNSLFPLNLEPAPISFGSLLETLQKTRKSWVFRERQFLVDIFTNCCS